MQLDVKIGTFWKFCWCGIGWSLGEFKLHFHSWKSGGLSGGGVKKELLTTRVRVTDMKVE